MNELRGTLTRRQLLAGGAALGAAWALRESVLARAASVAPAPGGLGAIDHVVFLMQENRSFDHYFGTLRGVRGFDDPDALPGVFRQSWPFGAGHDPSDVLLPFQLPATDTSGACVHDISHSWVAQHRSIDDGAMDAWATTHCDVDGHDAGPLTMGYLTRNDLSYYYALADAFTICDAYHCSVIGPTHPNRFYGMSATIDPAGIAGGPLVDNSAAVGSLRWTTMPEQLEQAGISWKMYQFAGTGPSGLGNNILNLFAAYQDPSTSLYRKAMLPTFPGEFEIDCATGQLPQVSWVFTPPGTDEHPSGAPAWGEAFVAAAVRAMTLNPDVWSRSVLFVTYDENGGFFDHVPPPLAPPGTSGEYLTDSAMPSAAGGIAGPIGLGPRVPCIVVSPFSAGGWVASETFDHTSMLRFVETRFGVEVPNLSEWRRETVGDLTSTLDLTNPVLTVPSLPDAAATLDAVSGLAQCGPAELTGLLGTDGPVQPVPSVQAMPHQEGGAARPRR